VLHVAASERTRLVVSVEALASVLWASRAEGHDGFRGGGAAIESERSTSLASDLTWLVTSVDAEISVVWASRAPVMMASRWLNLPSTANARRRLPAT